MELLSDLFKIIEVIGGSEMGFEFDFWFSFFYLVLCCLWVEYKFYMSYFLLEFFKEFFFSGCLIFFLYYDS